MEVQDAARAACVSRRFLRSWRFYSNLTLNKKTLGLTGDDSEGSEIRFINKIDKILNNYSRNGMKVKTLKIVLFRCKSVSASHVDRWLRIAAKSGINELSLLLPNHMKDTSRFPYSVLFDDTTTSPIQSLYYLSRCIFHPIETLGCFGRLKSLDPDSSRFGSSLASEIFSLASPDLSIARLPKFLPCVPRIPSFAPSLAHQIPSYASSFLAPTKKSYQLTAAILDRSTHIILAHQLLGFFPFSNFQSQ
jgi:hypothetical protein